MKRLDLYINEEQFIKLEELQREGLNKSFLVRRAIDHYLDSEDFKTFKEFLKEKK